MWDTPGGEKFKTVRDIDYSQADAVILVFNSANTFKEIEEFRSDALRYSRPAFFLVENKNSLL